MAQTVLKGFATREGTTRFRNRFPNISDEHFKPVDTLLLSDIGIGTYLGNHDSDTDARYKEAISESIRNGVNVIDTAINYRHQRSERAIGAALASLISEGQLSRDEIIVATKGGYISFDGDIPKDPREYFMKTYIQPGVIKPTDLVAGCHCMHPNYIRHEIETSLKNLGLETIDIYYLHNVETQFDEVERDEFEARLTKAFEVLEDEVKKGRIRRYGLATWDGFRVPPEAPNHLSLSLVLEIAEVVAGKDHHFKVVQLPFNLLLREASFYETQLVDGQLMSFLTAAALKNIIVMTSVPLFQSRLLGQMPPKLQSDLGAGRSDAQRAIAFAASAPGVTSALIGMSRTEHVAENTAYLKTPRLDLTAFKNVLDNFA